MARTRQSRRAKVGTRWLLLPLAVLSVSLTSCHARWNPLASHPRIHCDFGARTKSGIFNRPLQATLVEPGNYWQLYTFDVPARATLKLSVRANDSEVPLDLEVTRDGGVIAGTVDQADKSLTVTAEPGELTVTVIERGELREDVAFTLLVEYAQASPPEGGTGQRP